MSTLFEPPASQPSAPSSRSSLFTLRDYQRRAVAACVDALRDGGSTLLVLPTGCGKTVVFAHVIREILAARPGARAIVLAHRAELIAQNAETISRVLGEPVDIEMAEFWADPYGRARRRVIVASKDTLHERRLARFDPAQFALVVTDEAHHATAETYRRVYNYFAGVPHLGVTATPDRYDEAALGQVFDSVALDYEIADAIADGWLVPLRARALMLEGFDLSGLHTVAGDLDQGELDEAARNVVVQAAAAILRLDVPRSIVFCVSVAHARALADELNRMASRVADWVCGETERDERLRIIASHKAGAFRYLCNVGVLTEGYDDPGVESIVIARPTKSRALYAQMLGRGTRPLPGVVDGIDDREARRAAIAASSKPFLRVFDLTGNPGRHRLVTPADILGGKYDDDAVRAASARVLAGEVDVSEALEEARQERESEEEKRTIAKVNDARARIVSMVRYIIREVDLFDDGCAVVGVDRAYKRGTPPTERQIAVLERAGFKREDIENLNRGECSRLIGAIIDRRNHGLATPKQVKLLARYGIDAREMPFDEASARITAISRSWKR